MKFFKKSNFLLIIGFFVVLFFSKNIASAESGYQDGFSCYVNGVEECYNMPAPTVPEPTGTVGPVGPVGPDGPVTPEMPGNGNNNPSSFALAECAARYCPAGSNKACSVNTGLCLPEISYACLRNDGECQDIKYFGAVNLRVDPNLPKCQAFCQGTNFSCQAIAVVKKCSEVVEFSCLVQNGKCQPISSDNKTDAQQKCLALCNGKNGCVPQIHKCLPPKQYSCLLTNGDCFNNLADSLVDAQNQCDADCGGSKDCKATVGSCKENSKDQSIDDPASSLYGTSLPALQEMAVKQLNKAQASDPRVFISRAINLMTAFIGSIALLLYVVSGFLWMTASGASEQVDKAKKIMVWTTLGVVVMLFSYMLTSTLFDLIPK